jgi:hypothetical protein
MEAVSMRISRPTLRRRAAGLALPVVLIILAVMLVSSIYLMKSIHSTTLTTGNLAYDATLSQSVDLGLHTGFDWLKATAATSKTTLDTDSAANGYVALLDTTQTPRDDEFWEGSKTIAAPDGSGNIEYVIHRLCLARKPAGDAKNQCVQTAANTALLGTAVGLGTSLASDSPSYAGSPQVHYVITARLRGAKGASVTNQMIVLI